MVQSSNGNIILNVKEDVKSNDDGECKSIKLSYSYNSREIYVIEGRKYEEK